MARTYREQKTVTGDFMRVNIYPVRTYQYGRKKKHKPTGAAMAKLNKERKTRLLSDLVNLNFTKNDLQYKLDYSEFKKEFGRNPEPDEVQREMRNFMRRLKRWYKSPGLRAEVHILLRGRHQGQPVAPSHNHLTRHQQDRDCRAVEVRRCLES